RIPPVFVQKLKNELGSNVILQSPSGHLWDVKLCGTTTEMEFVTGWEKFVYHQKIELGDFLVFKYICRSYFKVRIFGRSGCQKNIIVFDPWNTYQHCDQPIDNKLSLVSDEEKNWQLKALAIRHPGCPQKKDQIESVKKRYQKSHYVSCRRAVTQAERNQALRAANSFSSDKPFCLITLKPSYVYNAVWLRIPIACRDRLQLPREKTKVILVDPNNNEWDVQYLGNLNQPGLSAGWRYFSFDNNLEDGDVCIFEQVDNSDNELKLRVHIFRVVEKCTPYKWMKGRQKNDSIALPTNYSNEKMKREYFAPNFGPEEGRDAKLVKSVLREDVVVNMSATAFGTEQGEEAKRVNLISREELATNWSCKAFEPEQRKDVKQVKTVSCEDLAANLSGKALGPEQRIDMKQVNTVSRGGLTANMLANALGPGQIKDAKQMNRVSSEDLSAILSGKAFGPEQRKDAKQVNTVSREDLDVNMFAKALGSEQRKDSKQVNTVSSEYVSAHFPGKAFGLDKRIDVKHVNTVSRGELFVNMLPKQLGPEHRKDAKQVNTLSGEDLAINMLAEALRPEQRTDAKQVNTVCSEDLSAKFSGKTFGSEQRKDAKQINTVSREDLAVNMLAKASGPEQRNDAKQVNTVSSEDHCEKFSGKEFGSEQGKDAKEVNTVSKENLAVNMFTEASGPKQKRDAEQVSTVSSEELPAKLLDKAFVPVQRKYAKQVITVSREDHAFNILAKALGHEQEIKHLHGKKENASTGRYKRAKYMPAISERKTGCRRSLRLAQRCNVVEHPKKDQLCSASSVDGKESIGSDTMLLSKKTPLDDVNGYDEEDDLMIIWDSNDVTHVKPPRSKGLVLSQESS
ncbi:hypothetical protein KI387_037480, partial [Taxus chinensis]